MRSVAALRWANLVTGLTPGRLFQTSSNRLLSLPIASANCFSVEKRAPPVSLASRWEAWKVMLFALSIVKCFMFLSLRGVCRGDHIHHSGRGNRQANYAKNHSIGGKQMLSLRRRVRALERLLQLRLPPNPLDQIRLGASRWSVCLWRIWNFCGSYWES